jgi:hypothetical protein
MQHELALVRGATVFEEVEGLPGAEEKAGVGDRDGEGGLGEGGAQVAGMSSGPSARCP